MQLSLLVQQEKWQEFDEAWRESMAAPELADLLAALSLAASKKRIGRCVPLVREQAELLESGGEFETAAQVVGRALVHGGSPVELSEILGRLVHSAYGEQDWWGLCSSLTGFDGTVADLRGPWKMLSRFLAFQPETLLVHPGGWGVGEVLSRDDDAQEIQVRFHNGRKDRFPLRTAIEIFDPLEERDLKARHFRDPEGLRKEVKAEPLEVLRTLATQAGGQITTNTIKTALMQVGIEGSAWSAWWRKARKLAENSEWFEVSGSAAKAVLRLLATPKDPAEALRRSLSLSTNLAEAHQRVRDFMAAAAKDDALLPIALEELARAAERESEPLQERLAAWLLLRDVQGTTPEPVAEVLAPYVAAETPEDPSEPHPLWQLFQHLPSSKDQERAASLLEELYGEACLDHCVANLQHAAPGMVRPLYERLVKAKREDDLLATYGNLLARPLRAPALLVHLAAHFEKKSPEGDLPTPAQRAQALLTLAGHLYETRRGNPHLTRVCSRLTDLLSKGSPTLLSRLLGDADASALRGASLICTRGVDSDVDRAVTDVALAFDRHFFAGQTGPFWDGATIWTTKQGMERRSAELKELRDVKIPANQEAIGKAASYGDLSENSEWEAAIEEQRNLTQRAMEIENELREADLLENVALPDGVAAPGTRVRYRESDGREREVAILGPWDGEQWAGLQVVSYRAPLAAGLLGAKVGRQVTLHLPTGDAEVEVLDISPLELE
ncbi:MAG: GreA/GreB family elongation factor [Planctomycetes bacterium]|nr:GreA/GreB family elongation factor [Planctomycetota bacterium]